VVGGDRRAGSRVDAPVHRRSDPSPPLAEFQSYVASGRIHWFIGGGVGRSDGGSDAASEISAWVAANFPSTTVDGVTLYDLSSGGAGA
jgi:hypothetical protein